MGFSVVRRIFKSNEEVKSLDFMWKFLILMVVISLNVFGLFYVGLYSMSKKIYLLVIVGFYVISCIYVMGVK